MNSTLQQLPSDWPVVRLKDVCSLNRRSLPESTDEHAPLRYIDIGGVDAISGVRDVADVSFGLAPSRARRLVESGDSIVSTVRTYLKAIAYISDEYSGHVVSTGFATLTPGPSVYPRFLYWWLRSSAFVEEIVARSVGVSYPAVNASDIADVAMPLPPLEVQARIARFLDEESRDIDELVDEQTSACLLLAERRAALITSVLGGALSETKERVHSGVPWIGAIPPDWDVMRLKHIGRASIGLTYDPKEVTDEGSGTLVLRSGNIQHGRISLDDNVFVTTHIPPRLRTQEGDIIICSRNGSVRLIGKNALITKEHAGQTWGAFMTVFRSPMNPYISWVLASSIFSTQLGLFTTSTINQLTSSTLHNLRVPVPPEIERVRVVEYLNTATSDIDALVRESQKAIASAHERRGALISAATTGQLEVP
jgi:type I restriction enzyme S subunit